MKEYNLVLKFGFLFGGVLNSVQKTKKKGPKLSEDWRRRKRFDKRAVIDNVNTVDSYTIFSPLIPSTLSKRSRRLVQDRPAMLVLKMMERLCALN